MREEFNAALGFLAIAQVADCNRLMWLSISVEN